MEETARIPGISPVSSFHPPFLHFFLSSDEKSNKQKKNKKKREKEREANEWKRRKSGEKFGNVSTDSFG